MPCDAGGLATCQECSREGGTPPSGSAEGKRDGDGGNLVVGAKKNMEMGHLVPLFCCMSCS